MNKKRICVHIALVPEHYAGDFSITLHAKPSEIHSIVYDLKCVLHDAVDVHKQFKNVKVVDKGANPR